MSFKAKMQNDASQTTTGITYSVAEPRYTQYVNMPMGNEQATTLEQLAGYAIKEEAAGMNDKVYMVLDANSRDATSESIVVGPDMPNLDNFDENQVKSYEGPTGDTVYYVVGNDNHITAKTPEKEDQLHFVESKHMIHNQALEQVHFIENSQHEEMEDEEDGEDNSPPKKKRKKSKCLKDEPPTLRYPPPFSEIPVNKRGLKHRAGCKHCQRAHMEDISKLVAHYCGYCNYGSYEIDALNTHIEHKHPQDEENWFIRCRRCNHRTVCKRNMRYHYAYVHDTRNNFYCNFCSFNCIVRKEYYEHVIDNHAGERPYKCAFCLYRSNFESDLDKHMTALHPDQVSPTLYLQ